MELFAQQLVNGIWQGAALALFAVGFTLVFGLLDVVNLAHGANYMWGAFFGWVIVTKLQWSLWLAIPVAMIGAGLLAIVLDRLAFKPLRSLTTGSLVLWGGFLVLLLGIVGKWDAVFKWTIIILGSAVMLVGIILDYFTRVPLRQRPVPHLAPMIASIGFSIILINLAQGIFGAQVSRFPPGTMPLEPVQLPFNAVIAPVQILVLGIALALMIALNFLITRTQVGRAIRAIAYNERTSRLLGINVDLVVAQTFFLSGALSGAAGVLLGLALNRLEPLMGNEIELAGLTAIIVGGLGSIWGTVAAAFLVGLLRVFSVAYLDSSFRDAFVFALLIIILLVRPNGLFGRGSAVRA
jgi:branched-chain amino acid transport system permease protein